MSDASERTNNEEDIASERKVYTPDTGKVRTAYVHGIGGTTWYQGKAEMLLKQFDRWLAEVKAQAVADDREALLRIAKGKNKGCSGHECEECERIMLVDDIVVSRTVLISQLEEYQSE